MIDSTTIDRIFAAANVVEVVSDFVTLKKKGVNYQACCPFHNEKTPSFVVSPTKGLFKCFGCGKGGNAVTFVMEHENLGYVDALKYVAKKYGIEIQERELTPDEVRRNDDRESMLVVSSYAADYFSNELLRTEEGQSVGVSYFRERGFSDATIQKFQLGYCSMAGDKFTKEALAAGYKEEYLISTGLSGKREDGRHYDRFFGRVMFPIHSISGRVTAFGGRTLRTDKKTAKYVNSPESEIYHKSNILYGLFHSKRSITQEDCCILVEGYTDVISMHQSGVENVVASSGTSLTTDQIRLIARFTKNVTVIYDGDSAGIKASLRGIDMILREGLNVRVVLLPDGEDPDSFARSHSATQLKEFIQSAEEDFISFKTRLLLEDTQGDPIKKGALITDIVQSIAEIPDPIMRSIYIKECAKAMDVDEQLLVGEVARKRITHSADAQTKEFIRSQQEIQSRLAIVSESPIVGRRVGSNIEELEKEIVKYLMLYGEMNFDYKEGRNMVSLNVADTIVGDLQANEFVLQNKKFKALYDTYIEHSWQKSDVGKTAPIEPQWFINHKDPNVCNAAVDILTENDYYRLSKLWMRHAIPQFEEVDRLADIVPRSILIYKSKTIESIIALLNRELGDENLAEEQLCEITLKITLLNKERTILAKKTGRLTS